VPSTADGDTPQEEGYPTLAEKLAEDLSEIRDDCPLLICITGDITQVGSVTEYTQAENFISDLLKSPILKSIDNKKVFVVPGNHDVDYKSEVLGERFQQYIEFHNRLYKTAVMREEPHNCQMVYDHSSDGYVVVCINSSIYVQKDTSDEKRGRIGTQDLERLQNELESFPEESLSNSIKIALIHHHPVLIPSLTEVDRGYDAVHNSEKLINILKKFGFHAILHGHKHNPHTFTEDIIPAYRTKSYNPMLIVAGGSAGSTDLPDNPKCLNSYNKISIKWHPKGEQTRIRVETRGLKIHDEDNNKMIATRWFWEMMNIDDRHFFAKNNIPKIANDYTVRDFDENDEVEDRQRKDVYVRSRGNLPVVDVLPSLEPDQAYDAIIWIVQHKYGEPKEDKDIPIKVVYSAGSCFDVIEVNRDQSRNFTAKLTFWGPMLVRVKMIFEDRDEFITHIYARMPNQY